MTDNDDALASRTKPGDERVRLTLRLSREEMRRLRVVAAAYDTTAARYATRAIRAVLAYDEKQGKGVR